MIHKKFLENFPLGALIGSVLAFLFCAIIDSNALEETKRFYTYALTIVVSLAAAAIALSGVLANLNLQVTLRKEERERKLSAARAFLPHALSEMCEVARYGMINCHSARNINPRNLGADFIRRSIEEIRLSDEIISIFTQIIENSSDNSSKRIRLILKEHQVFSARWLGHVRNRENMMEMSGPESTQSTTAWAYLYVLTATAFDYARGETDDISEHVDEARIASALRSVQILPNADIDNFDESIGLYVRHYRRQIAS